ncbi:MAG: low molecular weight phosphotyrosine protein phosphatase [Chitinophagaceae bacterium]|nr:low molecular weight phosphotyrosine protein phosphatase [Chitinophagaceae bacterium]
MVCLGNICRSPIAEGVLRKLAHDAGKDWQIDSAGTNGLHVGEAPHRSSQKICKQHGIDICKQKAKRFTIKDFEQYDIIYALASDVYEDIAAIAKNDAQMTKVKLFLNELEEGSNASVPDPWYGGEEGYLPVYLLIEQTCKKIVAKHRA